MWPNATDTSKTFESSSDPWLRVHLFHRPKLELKYIFCELQSQTVCFNRVEKKFILYRRVSRNGIKSLAKSFDQSVWPNELLVHHISPVFSTNQPNRYGITALWLFVDGLLIIRAKQDSKNTSERLAYVPLMGWTRNKKIGKSLKKLTFMLEIDPLRRYNKSEESHHFPEKSSFVSIISVSYL